MIESISEPLTKTRRQRGDKVVLSDRLPPHSVEAEQGVLGCALLAPDSALADLLEKIKDATVFYDLRHQTIYGVLVEMFNQRVPVDLITVRQKLKDAQMLEQIGGIAYLGQLEEAVPSAANLSYYLEILLEKFLLRRMLQVCTASVGKIYDYEGDVSGLLDELEKDVLRIAEARETSEELKIQDLVQKSINGIERMFERQGALGGIGTGFADLDKMTDGLHGGEMWVIAARPSMGKTSLAMNIAEHVACEQGLPVGVFSLEMSGESLTTRMMAGMARVNLRTIRDGFMSESEFPKLTGAAGRLNKAPLHIDDTAGLSILQFRARARRMFQKHKIKLFVVDYLQLLNAAGKRSEENRQQEIADISSGIKALAKELNVPVIVLSQMNREIEKEKNRKPRLADLRESGAIEQDADLVGLLYKPDRDKEGDVESDGIAVNLLIAKQRNGPTGDVCLMFLKPYTRFETACRFSDEDVQATKPYND